MNKVRLSLLRGVCQMPAYVADARGIFTAHGLDVQVNVGHTAWVVPDRLLRGELDFAVMPWTSAVAASARGEPIVLICGSGREEAAIVVRTGLEPSEVRRVAVPLRGGIKDVTALGLAERLGWSEVEWVRQPSGDGAILSFVGEGVDAASMVEPYASMLEGLGAGKVVGRTGDLWPGAPGCSLATTRAVIDGQPELVQRMVSAYVEAARWGDLHPDEAATIAARTIGIHPRFIRASLARCRNDVCALRNEAAMASIMELMKQRGYLPSIPSGGYHERTFLDRTLAEMTAAAVG